jgi:hypothetical protein
MVDSYRLENPKSHLTLLPFRQLGLSCSVDRLHTQEPKLLCEELRYRVLGLVTDLKYNAAFLKTL